MSQVVHSSSDSPQLQAKLESLVEKLLALRAEIDSTLADLRVDPTARLQSPPLADRLAELHRTAVPSEVEAPPATDVANDWVASAGEVDEPAAEPVSEIHSDIEAEPHETTAKAVVDDEDLYAEITEPDPEAQIGSTPFEATTPQQESDPSPASAHSSDDDDLTVPDTQMAEPLTPFGSDIRLHAPVAEDATPSAPTGLMQDVQLAHAAALLSEARIISMQDHRLRDTAPAASVAARRRHPRRGRYVAATLATAMAASLGFAVVMFTDLDEAGARSAASDSLRSIIEQTKRHFEPRHEGIEAISPPADKQPDDAAGDLWIRQMEMWSMGA